MARARALARDSALVIISHDRRFLSNLSRSTVGSTRMTARIGAALPISRWRDAVLEERSVAAQARPPRSSPKRLMRYGVTRAAQRNMRRVAELSALRKKRAHLLGQAARTITAGAAAPSGRLGD